MSAAKQLFITAASLVYSAVMEVELFMVRNKGKKKREAADKKAQSKFFDEKI